MQQCVGIGTMAKKDHKNNMQSATRRIKEGKIISTKFGVYISWGLQSYKGLTKRVKNDMQRPMQTTNWNSIQSLWVVVKSMWTYHKEMVEPCRATK